ncbi:hypothetical protein LNKW23_09970 [Paralimibaculum aggregatum]|uniref:Uncharacterized protein n=1 Tax=Paralimibaculum aggregatum TaxID=3036245 RepID=A0ABQ6LEK5_9RHOB|nr:hypothetical protein [Limibaculum sp. NKW23]GMG81784.1 hypothetical protein LNKW23_09970 [Limibaculum sp. NKW23]
MGKSKHPKLLPKALKDIADLNTTNKKNGTILGKLKTLCDGTKSTADSVIKNCNAQYKYLQAVIERYATKVAEIQEEEDKDTPDEKKLAALEKEADKIRKEYNDGTKVLVDLTAAMKEQMDKLAEAANDRGFTTFAQR